MKRVVIEPAREEVLFREMKKALPYMERGIDWSDLKRSPARNSNRPGHGKVRLYRPTNDKEEG